MFCVVGSMERSKNVFFLPLFCFSFYKFLSNPTKLFEKFVLYFLNILLYIFQSTVLSMHLELMSIHRLEFLKGSQNNAMDLHLGRQFWLEKLIWGQGRWEQSWRRSWQGSTEGMHTIWFPKTATIFAMMLALDSQEIQSQVGLIGLLESVRPCLGALFFLNPND